MRTFYSEFENINGKLFKLEITSDEATGDDVYLKLSGTPCEMTTSSSSLFAPIKSRSLTISIVSKEWYFDLYEPKSRGTQVKLYEWDKTNNVAGKTWFRGLLKPNSYDQDFVYLDEIELEAVDAISTAKDYKWVNNNQYNSFIDMLIPILQCENDNGYKTGYRGYLYVPETYTKLNGENVSQLLTHLYASSNNFLDNDDEHTPWTQYEVASEICQFLGWSLVPDGDDVWLVDYRGEYHGSVTYSRYNIQTGTYVDIYKSSSNPVEITLESMASGKSKIDLDAIYNKIEISDSLYEIEDLTPDIFDDGTHISVTDEKGLGVDSAKWTNTETKKFLWWVTSETTTITGYDYQTICRLNPASGWKHYYYKCSDLSPLPNDDGQGYYLPNSGSNYTTGKINKYVNTHGCLIQHYAHLKENGTNNVPSTLDWTDILTFFVANDTTPNFNIQDCDKFEKKVLEYETSESINWQPASGCSWITIKGALFYQYNGVTVDDNRILNIVNENNHYYTTAPVDKAVETADDLVYCSIGRGKNYLPWEGSGPNPLYGLGIGCWKMSLQIGEGADAKWWSETVNINTGVITREWVDHPATFYIRYNNNPDGNENQAEYIPAFKWMNTVNTNSFKDKVGVDAYCIPIESQPQHGESYKYGIPPTFGKLILSIYTPSIMPNECMQLFKRQYNDYYASVNWKSIPPVIYCKDFELGYTYTDENVWWNNHDSTDNKDKVYVGYIDETFKNEFDGLTFKLNTALKDKPISRSFVSFANGGMTGNLQTLRHQNANPEWGDVDKEQEYNVIDEYLDHHSDRRVIYKRNMTGYFRPNAKFTKPGRVVDGQLEGELEGTFMIDTQSYDFRNDNNSVKYIAY